MGSSHTRQYYRTCSKLYNDESALIFYLLRYAQFRQLYYTLNHVHELFNVKGALCRYVKLTLLHLTCYSFCWSCFLLASEYVAICISSLFNSISLGLQLEQESFLRTFSTLGQKNLARHINENLVHVLIWYVNTASVVYHI